MNEEELVLKCIREQFISVALTDTLIHKYTDTL